MFPYTVNINLYTADVDLFIKCISFVNEGWDLQSLHRKIRRDFGFPCHTSIVLFYKNKSLTYLKEENFKVFARDLNLNEVCVEVAACFSEDPQVVEACQLRSTIDNNIESIIPMIKPLVVKTKGGDIAYTLEKVLPFYTVDYLVYKVSKALNVNPTVLEFYHQFRKLDIEEILSDLYFELGVFNANVEAVVYRTDLDFQHSTNLKQVTIAYISGYSVIDLTKERILNVYKIKDFIRRTRRIPLSQQTLIHEGEVLKGYELLHDIYQQKENGAGDGNITFTLVLQPYSIKVKFFSDYIEIPDDICSMDLLAMTSLREMTNKISEGANLDSEEVQLVPWNNSFGNSDIDIISMENLMLHELKLGNSPALKLVRGVKVKINGENIIYSIQRTTQTVSQLKRDLEIYYGLPEKKSEFILQNDLCEDTILVNLTKDDVMRFEEGIISRCCICI